MMDWQVVLTEGEHEYRASLAKWIIALYRSLPDEQRRRVLDHVSASGDDADGQPEISSALKALSVPMR